MTELAVRVPIGQWLEWRGSARALEQRQRMAGGLAAAATAVAIIGTALVTTGATGLLSSLIYGPLLGWMSQGIARHAFQFLTFRSAGDEMRAAIVPEVSPKLSVHDAFHLALHAVWISNSKTMLRVQEIGSEVEIFAEPVEVPEKSLWETVASWGSTGQTPAA